MGATSSQQTFGKWLDARLAERQWGTRTLAFRMESDPKKAEHLRRNLIRYRQGLHVPTLPMVYAIADALGIDRDEAAEAAKRDDADAEEDQPVDLDLALRSYLRRLIREEAAKVA